MEDALLYRWQTVQSKRPLWVRTLSKLGYPLLVFSPCFYGYFQQVGDFKIVLFLSLFLHFFYLCAGSLSGTITAFSSEKQKRTFESLLTTGVSAKEWLNGTLWIVLKPIFTDLFLYSLLWLPLLSRLSEQRFFEHSRSGLEGGCFQLGLLLVVSTVAILSHSALGCFLSLRARSTQAAQMQASVIFTIIFFLLIPLDVMLIDPIFHCNEPVLSSISPWICFILQTDHHRSLTTWSLLGNAFFHITAAICLYHKTLWVLRNPVVAVNSSSSDKSLASFGDSLAPVSDPILYRSYLGYRRRPWAFWAKLAAGPCIAVSLRYGLPILSGKSHGSDIEGSMLLALAICLIGWSAQAISTGIEAFSADKERGTFECLQLTNQKSNQLFRSQWLVTALPILLQTIVTAPFWLLFVREIPNCNDDICYTPRGLSLEGACWMGCYGLFWTLFVSSITLWIAQRSPKTGTALTKSVGLIFLLVIGLPILDGLLFQDFKWLSTLGPVIGSVGIIEHHHERRCLVGLFMYLVLGLLALWKASAEFSRAGRQDAARL
jgi:hypothetical protein